MSTASALSPDALPSSRGHGRSSGVALAIAAVGVVFGDIGTSPLYTLRECFTQTGLFSHTDVAAAGSAAVMVSHEVTRAAILGFLSLIVWTITLVVTFKYVWLLMRADNRGEGGILSMMALALGDLVKSRRRRFAVILLGLIGAALFYGDSLITPAISVLAAVEGLKVVDPAFEEVVVPVALVILVGLFIVQSAGSRAIGAVAGPIMCVWFIVLGALGIAEILRTPDVLAALSPTYAVHFLATHPGLAIGALGAVVLAVTGAEAVYADMGHFGRSPIRKAWFALVFPGLILNYFGQGALLLSHLDDPARLAEALQSPFFRLVPEWGQLPMVVLATAATVIASQAVISGAFSLTHQAVQLGFLPRTQILHTSAREAGQIYIPSVNWLMMVGVGFLVLAFRSSTDLASAYGIAVTGTMVCETTLALFVFRRRWAATPWAVVLFGVVFLLLDLALFGANLPKLPAGGWLPLAIAIALVGAMMIWRRGKGLLAKRRVADSMSVDELRDQLGRMDQRRVEGTAVFLTSTPGVVPQALLHNLKHNKVLHEYVVLLTVLPAEVPYVAPEERVTLEPLGRRLWRATLHFGFMEAMDVPRALAGMQCPALDFDQMRTSFFVGRESLVPQRDREMPYLAKLVFAWMSKNAQNAADFFHIPSNRVVELGAQVEF